MLLSWFIYNEKICLNPISWQQDVRLHIAESNDSAKTRYLYPTPTCDIHDPWKNWSQTFYRRFLISQHEMSTSLKTQEKFNTLKFLGIRLFKRNNTVWGSNNSLSTPTLTVKWIIIIIDILVASYFTLEFPGSISCFAITGNASSLFIH